MKKKDVTRKRIVEEFLKQYEVVPNKVSVTSVTSKLNINRGTFYLHFFDIDDLLTSIEDEHLEMIRLLNAENRRFYLSGNLSELKHYYISTLSYINSHKQTIKVLLSNNARPRFREILTEIMTKNAREKVGNTWGTRGMEYKHHVIDIIVGVNMGIITNWILSEKNQTVDEIANLFVDILRNLPYFRLATDE